MIHLQDVLELDFAFLETFTKRINTPWGALFFNNEQPTHYDSNHAHISESSEDPAVVIDEVINFYQSRKVIPRFYIYNIDKQQKLLTALSKTGFQYEELISPVQLWNNQIAKRLSSDDITIEKVTSENYQAAFEIECSITEFGGKEAGEQVFETQFHHPAFTHYLLKYKGVASSTACVFTDGNQARLESVATLEAFRGKGLVGELIHYIQNEVSKQGVSKLWVFPINESIEKVYQKYGFETVQKLTMGHAFLGGKSIKEIQGK
ncbi:GNAT family N-acetyltransferase [Radiobacillus sp. PE A8.2]|uniref:GNAT family N-acetyltransferase n=1 Tax=Radiobacillus sp. PE A8.2 TaxID=3380349 RepID=UPI00388E0B4A